MDPTLIRPFRQVLGELSISIADIIDPSFVQQLFSTKVKFTIGNPVAYGKMMGTENNNNYWPTNTTATLTEMMNKVV